jgi:D-amino-acid dehydrogenase
VPAGDRINHVEATDPSGRYVQLSADSYVLAAGSFSPALAAPLGLRLPIYPAKGYSLTAPVTDPSLAFEVSLTDDEYKLVFSRYTTQDSNGTTEDRLRIAGTAELGGYERQLNETRCQGLLRRTQELFPGAADLSRGQFWSGLRPSTPSNVPLIGRSRVSNLFINTGHGTLGWTHSCGSGKALADIMSGHLPEVDFAFLGAGPPRPASRQSAAANTVKTPE